MRSSHTTMRGRRLLAGTVLLAPVVALAQASDGPRPGQVFDALYLMQVLGSLLLVFGCIFGLLYLLKRINGLPMASGSPLRVLGSTRVGSREKVLLLEAGDCQLLVGVAAGNVRTLHVFDEPIIDSAQAPGAGRDFASLLQATRAGREQP